jgi:hypothetical protein
MQRLWLMTDAQINSHDSDFNDWNYTYGNDLQIPRHDLCTISMATSTTNLSSFVNDICGKNFRGYILFSVHHLGSFPSRTCTTFRVLQSRLNLPNRVLQSPLL